MALLWVAEIRGQILTWICRWKLATQNGLRRLASVGKNVPIKPSQQKAPKSKKPPFPLTKRNDKKGRKNRLSAKKEAHWGVILTYWGTFVTLIAFGYTVIDDHIFIATGLFIAAVLQLVLGMLLWFGANWNRFFKAAFSTIAVGLFISSFYRPFVDGVTPTFLYLVPTHELN